MNLSAALFLLNVTFLTNTRLSSSCTDSLCKAMAVLLHYSLLCSFTWMGIEAFHLYIMLIKVFNTYIKCYMLKLRLVGWGIPAGVLSIIVGVSTDNYGWYSIPVNGNYSSTGICWITNKTVHYITNIAYFVLIFLGNTTMLIILCVKVIRLKGVHYFIRAAAFYGPWPGRNNQVEGLEMADVGAQVTLQGWGDGIGLRKAIVKLQRHCRWIHFRASLQDSVKRPQAGTRGPEREND
ncbi:adhesion G-protein coupled receptor G2-like [Carcharodon carcharias]|uniref:adhesion G-protein coupled receptor G2-like n=1 Tax=Carcharodon carcharias TaxID=13397 RepID=UPI001B7F108F|nr:adhesion G-protein coupled receptor G2-like [Carcharodon carcharias]